jgi:cyclopropane fatty-acyl-phospholipid synthase-like methyltransferase
MRDLAATLRAWRSYAGAGPGARAFAAARLSNLPLGSLDAELRGLRGRVLSLGSGFGVVERYIAEINAAVEIDGLELDAARVRAADRTQPAAPRVRLRVQDVRSLAEAGAFDGAIAFDVLHHVPLADHAAIARALLAALRPGAPLLVKDIATTPAWQHRFNQVHDRIVTGETSVDARAPEDMADVFAGAGFAVEGSRRIGRVSPYPHYLLTLRRPA